MNFYNWLMEFVNFAPGLMDFYTWFIVFLIFVPGLILLGAIAGMLVKWWMMLLSGETNLEND